MLIAPGSYTNTATVASDMFDLFLANNTASLAITVLGVADISVSQSAVPSTVFVSSNLTFVVTVTNRGPFGSTGVILSNTLPSGVVFLSATSSLGTCSQAAGVVSCHIGTLPINGAAQMGITVATTTDGTLTNSAVVLQAEVDPDAQNNSSVAMATVQPLADLALTQSA